MSQAQGAGVSPAEVEETLREVLSRPGFGKRVQSTEESLVERFFEWLGDLFSDGDAEEVVSGALGASEVLLWVVVAAGSAFLLWHLFLIGRPGFKRWQARQKELLEEGLVERRVEALRRLAREAEEAADWTRALRLHFFAAVVGLGERGDLDYRDAWTNRELLERGDPSAQVRGTLSPLMQELDERSFGLRPTEAVDVRRFSSICEGLMEDSAA